MPTKESYEKPATLRAKSVEKEENILQSTWEKAGKYFKGVKAEFQRISWPTRQELRYNTIVVIVVTMGISAYMWLVDKALTLLFHLSHRTSL